MDKNDKRHDKPRTLSQNASLHLGCTQIADTLVEHGISLQVALKNLDVRPSMESIKDAFRQIAHAKFNVSSTADLKTHQINQVWEDLTKTLSINTGVLFHFPSEQMRDEAWKDYEY